MKYDFEHSYWLGNGPERVKADEMKAAGFELTRRTEDTFHRYYRFHNDGDAPARIRSLMRSLRGDRLQNHPEYTAYCSRREEQVTARIQIEYRRFRKAHKPA